MSNMESHVGKLRKIQRNEGQSVEDWCREKCEDNGVPSMISGYHSWKETLLYHLDFYEKFFFVNDEIWEVLDHRDLDYDDDIYEMTPNPDGTISFVMRFYNGGTNLQECIAKGLKKINKNI